MNLQDLEQFVAAGESETVEFKKSTAQLPRAGETLCAFLNGQGGRVFIGITAEGRIVGQQVSDGTLREVAAMLARFEPPASISQERIILPDGFEVIVLSAPAALASGPFVFDGRPYRRVGPTTSAMPRARYQALLLDSAHVHSRWESAPAHDVSLKQLDREEILRTVRLGIEAGRLPESTGRNIGEILDRLSLRKNGQILNSAVVLFGKDSVFGYP
jgi:ATP-dependent DNA helicase RecG